MKKISTFKQLLSLSFTILLFILPKLNIAQTNYYYNGGIVTDTLSWGANQNGTGTNPSNFVGGIFHFTGNNATSNVAVPTTWAVTGTGGKVVVSNGVNLIIDSAGLAANTTINVDSLSVLTLRGTNNISLGILHPTSTVAYDGKVYLNFIPASYGNLASTNDSSYRRKFVKASAINVAGVYTPGKSTYSDSCTFTFNGLNPQDVPTHSYFNLVIANANCMVDSGEVVTIKAGGTITVNGSDSLHIENGGKINYHSTKTSTLTGILHADNGGTFLITANLSSVPKGIMWDSASNLVIGDGSTSVKTLPKLVLADTYGNVVINAPAVTTSLGARLLPNNAGTYNIAGNLNIAAGRVTNSSGTATKGILVNGDLIINGGFYYISDSSTSTKLDKIDVAGDVYVTAGALFMTHDTAATFVGKGELIAEGDVIHTGGLLGVAPNSLTTGKILFNTTDTAGQGFSTIGITDGTGPTGLLRLQVGGGQEVEILSNVTTNDTVVIASGYFTVTPGNTFTLNRGVKGYNDSNYIITDAVPDSISKGVVRFNNIPKNTWTTLPVGNDSTFQPIMVNTADDSSSYSIVTFNNVTKNGDLLGGLITDPNVLTDLVNSTWYIQRNDTKTSSVNTVFKWNKIMEGTNFASLPDNQISILQNNGSGAMLPIASTAFNASDSASTMLTSFGEFMIAKTTISLPLTFINVTAKQQKNAVIIEWQTEGEINLFNYIVEKSFDGKIFIPIGEIVAQNKPNNHYSHNDGLPSNGTKYYRIKSIDLSGKISYSSVVKVSDIKENMGIAVYPNPVINKTFNVQLNNQAEGIYTIQIINSLGETIFTKQITYNGGNSINTIDVSNSSAKGICFVKVISKEHQTISTVLIK